MCPVSSGFPFREISRLPLARTVPSTPPGPDRRFAISGALLWILYPLCVWTERKMILLLIDTSFFPKHAKCSCQPLLVNIYTQIITGLKHQLSRENRMVILDIWNLEPG